MLAKLPVETQTNLVSVTVAAGSKQPSNSSYLVIPGGAEYRGGKYKTTTRMGSTGETRSTSSFKTLIFNQLELS